MSHDEKEQPETGLSRVDLDEVVRKRSELLDAYRVQALEASRLFQDMAKEWAEAHRAVAEAMRDTFASIAEVTSVFRSRGFGNATDGPWWGGSSDAMRNESSPPNRAMTVTRSTGAEMDYRLRAAIDALATDGPCGPTELTERVNRRLPPLVDDVKPHNMVDLLRKHRDVFNNVRHGVWTVRDGQWFSDELPDSMLAEPGQQGSKK